MVTTPICTHDSKVDQILRPLIDQRLLNAPSKAKVEESIKSLMAHMVPRGGWTIDVEFAVTGVRKATVTINGLDAPIVVTRDCSDAQF